MHFSSNLGNYSKLDSWLNCLPFDIVNFMAWLTLQVFLTVSIGMEGGGEL